MVHLLFPDGTTRDIDDVASVTRDEDTGQTHCEDADGRIVASFAPGEVLALSYKPLSPELIEAFRTADPQTIEIEKLMLN
jgi:hypothetical protein